MAEYRTDDGRTVVTERRRGGGVTIAVILLVIIAIVALLFATGFWRANVQGGSLPKVDVSAKGGALPKVDLDSKRIVVGSKSATVDVPKVETKKESISVPVVGVTEGKTDKADQK